jgi:alpha-L-arabinofuranosidase
VYGTPSYWLIKLFKESSGATFLNSTLETNSPTLAASAISWKSSVDGKSVLRIKVKWFSSAYLLFNLKYLRTIIFVLEYIRIYRYSL